MAVTIKDVAKIAGVSPSTVSRVIANHPRISLATQERVRRAMKEMEYHPNAIARSLVRQTSNTLGIVMSRSAEQAFSNPFFPEVIRGISSVARQYQFSLLLSTSKGYQEEQAESLQMLRHRKADGVILLASRPSDRLIDQLEEGGHPYVVVGRVPGRPKALWVNNDNVEAARLAVTHLIEQGHREIGFLGGIPDLFVTQDRLDGYRQALTAAGVPYRPEWVIDTDFTLDAGYAAALSLIDRNPRPTALFAIDDVLAIGALRALREQGLHVPGDMALMGFNDDPITLCVDPRLSTVRIPIFELGARATELLIQRIRSPEREPTQVILPSELVIRESTLGGPKVQGLGRLGDRRDGHSEGGAAV